MFPISDSIPATRFAYLNWTIIIVTCYVFFLQLTSPNLDAFIQQYALIPANVNWSNVRTLLPFITAIFLHGGFMHIISNMWFLKVFGDNVEGHMNPLKFLLLYFGAGILGNFLQYVIAPSSSIPMLGASGAVAGILGYYYSVFPHSQVKTLVFIFFFVTIINISAGFLLGYWFVLQIFSGVGSISQSASMGGIAFWAHIAGFITGILFAKLNRPQSEILEGEIIS